MAITRVRRRSFVEPLVHGGAALAMPKFVHRESIGRLKKPRGTVASVNRSLVTLYLNGGSDTVECRAVCGGLISLCFLNPNTMCVSCGHQSLATEHTLCGWSNKLVRYSNNPDVWVV